MKYRRVRPTFARLKIHLSGGLLLLLMMAFVTALVNAQTAEIGKQQFEVRCSGCHASDGTGGGRAPNIVDMRGPRAPRTTEALRKVIRNGMPGGGMPSFQIPDAELDAIVAYIGSLRDVAAENPVAGDAAAGRRFFEGKGNCSSCHMVRGRGGSGGPDLSNLAGARKLRQIEEALDRSAAPDTATDAESGQSYRAVAVKLNGGRMLRGFAKYETPFDLGLISFDGKFYSISKRNVERIAAEASPMPKVVASAREMRDLLAYLTRLTADTSPRVTQTGSGEMGPGISFDDVAHPQPGEWPTYNGQIGGNRHSPLTQINTGNVAGLGIKWIFTVSRAERGLEVTPVVVDGLMYVTALNSVWALDARNGHEIWHYRRPATTGLIGDASGGINRGVAILGDRVFLETDHAHLLALNRLTGQLLWDVEIADYRQGYGATSAPLVVNDLVIAGTSGGDNGIRGFVAAYKASTGERVWRFWTVPAPGEPGSETWSGKSMEHGCAATWLTGSYDPEARLIYWTTGNPCPDQNGDLRKGDNLYANSVVALDPDNGKLKWYFQFTPHDLHDWDSTETPVLVDAEFHGSPSKLLLHPDRSGFFYVLDRISGKLLLAEPFVKKLTWASGIDSDGRPKLTAANEPTTQGTLTCPIRPGATNWPSTAFSSATGLFYLMSEEACAIYNKRLEEWEPDKTLYGGGYRGIPGEQTQKYLRAIDVQTGRIVWETPVQGGILESGVMSTAGGLIFYGDGSGAFVAADARNGKSLWESETGQRWRAGPMTYAIDGRQYIGIAGGSVVMVFGLP